MKKLVSFLLILVAGFSASAADMGPVKQACSTVDLRKQVGPVRNQGNVGWCYANAAADLLSYRFRTELKGQQVSAISVALEFNTNQRDKSILDEGGQSDVAIEAYLGAFSDKNALCLQNAEDLVLNNGPQATLQDKLKAMQKLKTTYDAGRADSRRWKEFGEHWNFLKKNGSVLFKISEDRLRDILYWSTIETFPLKLKEEFCRGRSVYVDSSRVAVRELSLSPWLPFLKPKHLVEKLDEQLNKRNIISISYKASFLTTPTGELNEGTGHASVVVGRKWNQEKSQCEYLVRNSWGTECYGYENKDVRCEDGNFWITSSDLQKTMYGMTYLEAGIGLKWLQSTLSGLL